MDKAKRKKTTWLALTVFASVTGIPSAILAVIMAIKLKYFLMAVFILLALHGIWGGVFYYKAYLYSGTNTIQVDKGE